MADFLDSIFNRLPDDPLRSIKTVASDPMEFLKGASWTTLKNLAGAIAKHGGNIVQSFLPTNVDVPFATEKPDSIAERIGTVSNAALLGMPDAWNAQVKKQFADNGPNTSFEEKTLDVLKATKDFAFNDILPIGNAAKVLTGKSEGRALSAEEIGGALTGGLLQAAPLVGVLGKLGGRLANPGAYTAEVAALAKKTIGKTELAKYQELQQLGKDGASVGEIVDATKPPAYEPKPPEFRPEELAAQLDDLTGPRSDYNGFVKDGFTMEVFNNVVKQTAYSKIFKDIDLENVAKAEAYAKGEYPYPPTRVNENISLALRNGALAPEVLQGYAEKFNMPIDKVGDYLADGVKVFSNTYGKGLEVLSEVAKYNGFETAMRIIAGDKAAIAKFKSSLKQTQLTWDKVNNVQQLKAYINSGIRDIESFRRGLLVMMPRTAFRNFNAQALTHIGDAIDQLNTTLWQQAFKKFGSEATSVGPELERSFADIFTAPESKAVEAVLEEYPVVGATIRNETSNAVGQAMLTDMVKRQNPGTVGEVASWVSQKATIINQFQERIIRTWVFGQRLGQNARALGFKSVAEFLEDAKAKALQSDAEGGAGMLDTPHKMAIADAQIHALKQTFAYTPKTGFWAEILKFYNANPWMTAIGPTFPRFLANQYRFIMEHNPANLTKLFSKEYRAKLFDKNGEFYATRAAWDEVGKATTGIGMLTTAYAIRNSDVAGPNYYEIKLEDGTTFDTRAYQPFNSYMFLAHVMEKAFKDEPMNLSPNELSDAIAGVRRMSDVPMFGVQDLLRGMTSDDPEVARRPWSKFAGNYMSGFMQPFRVLNETYGTAQYLAGNKEEAINALAQRDTQTQELTGPSRSAIAAVTDLPKKIDAFSGDIKMAPTAGKQLGYYLAGINSAIKTPLQELIEKNGVEATALLPSYSSPELNNEVARRMGMVLSTKLANGRTINEELAAKVTAKGFTREMNQFVIQEALAEIKKAILPSLEADPRFAPFIAEDQIKHNNELKPVAKPIVEKLQKNFPALGWK